MTLVASAARQSLGVALAEHAARVLDWPGLGRLAPPPFTLVLADDSAAMARLTRGRAPGWGAGVAFPAARTIILRADLPDIDQTLRHELGHLILRTSIRGRVPLWFDEGYAGWASGEFSRVAGLELNLAVAAGELPTFQELDRMLRGSANSANTAYALASSAVAEIARREPPGGLAPMLARMKSGEEFGAALEASTGLSVDRFEERWQATLRHRYSLLTWLVAGGMWSILAFGLGGLLWYRRRRDRPRRAALDQGWILPDETVSTDADTGVVSPPPVDPEPPPQ